MSSHTSINSSKQQADGDGAVAGPSTSISNHAPHIEYRKDGVISNLRSHKGNIPVLPQTKLCPYCPAKFTRTTHLNRHLRTHTGERFHRCDTCDAQFTRSDLLTRHKKTCGDPLHGNRSRRRSCQACASSKIKCDLEQPCGKCTSRGRDCIFATPRSQSSSRSKLPSHPRASNVDSSQISSIVSDAPVAHGSLQDTWGIDSAVPQGQVDFSAARSYSKSPSVAETADSTADFGVSVTPHPVPVENQLHSLYSSDILAPFFSNIFASYSSTSGTESLPMGGVPTDEAFPFATDQPSGNAQSLAFPSINPVSVPHEPSVFVNVQDIQNGYVPRSYSVPEYHQEPTLAEQQHYLYLFFAAFLAQIPLIHPYTFQVGKKAPVLVRAMQACGALYVKTRTSTNFITKTMSEAREMLIQEFAKNSTDIKEQTALVVAVVLLQAVGLFHQDTQERASSSLYQEMLILMIRRTEIITRNASWEPSIVSNPSLYDVQWREWSFHEATKRALLYSYVHDCTQCMVAIPAAYTTSEVELYLPCDNALWKAKTASEWFDALHQPSAYGNSESRLRGVNMINALESLYGHNLTTTPDCLNSFALFVLIHAILRRLFIFGISTRVPDDQVAHLPIEWGSEMSSAAEQEMMTMHYALHNWLQLWLRSPDAPACKNLTGEPPFSFNALPFYWLGQVSILAYQEGVPPFDTAVKENKSDATFRLIKQWLRHIRGFLRKSDQTPTLFWDELMKMRLQSWEELQGGVPDEADGLLGLFSNLCLQ